MKKETMIILVSELLYFVFGLLCWIVIIVATNVSIFSWRFWALLVGVLGLILASNIKRDFMP